MYKNKRIFWIDVARSLAIISVVLCHIVESVYSLNLESMSGVSRYERICALSLFSIGRLGVPVFLLISGYLLLGRTYTDEKCRNFWKKNCAGLLLTTEIWIIIYNCFLALTNRQAFTVNNLIREMLFLKSVNLSHMWYMPMILGMYFLIPMAANALNSMKIPIITFAASVVSIIVLIFPILDIISKSLGYGDFCSILSTGFSGGEYGIYMTLGFLCSKNFFKKIKSFYLIIAGIFLFAAVVLLQLFAYRHNYAYNVWYNCGFLVALGLIIFELLSRIKCHSNEQLFKSIAKYSFGIYLIHNPIIILLNPYMNSIKVPELRIVVLWFVVLCVSWLIAFLINKIPKLGKILLYIN